jgi:DNA-directed RNA polymerase subunit RPC12/RpoP
VVCSIEPATMKTDIKSDLVLYTYKCAECGHVGGVQLAGDGHEGERAECTACGAVVLLEWDGGVTFHTGPRLTN